MEAGHVVPGQRSNLEKIIKRHSRANFALDCPSDNLRLRNPQSLCVREKVS